MQKANRTLRKKKYLKIGKTTNCNTATGLSLHKVVGVSIVRNKHGSAGPNHISIAVKCETMGLRSKGEYDFEITLFPHEELEL